MIAKDNFQRTVIHTTSAYKIMEMAGRFMKAHRWNATFALACHRAARRLYKLSPEESDVLNELYSRITCTRPKDNEVRGIMAFWATLHRYRKQQCRRKLECSDDQILTIQTARILLEEFKRDTLWSDLTVQQQRSKSKRSTLNTILNQRSGWTHAARAIMQYGFARTPAPKYNG